MPELESTCDLGSKTLFPTRSFTLEHRFAFDSRVPASSLMIHKLLTTAREALPCQPELFGIDQTGHPEAQSQPVSTPNSPQTPPRTGTLLRSGTCVPQRCIAAVANFLEAAVQQATYPILTHIHKWVVCECYLTQNKQKLSKSPKIISVTKVNFSPIAD